MQNSTVPGAHGKWKFPFFTIWTGQAFSILGSTLVQFALIWYLTKTTGSGSVLAIASLVGLLPNVLLGPVAGALVDRWNRRLTMIVADSVVALATLLLAGLFSLGIVEIWHIYTLMFIRSLAGSFHWMAMRTSTSLMVPKEHLSRVQGLNSILSGSMSIIAAPLGALLLEVLPLQGVLLIDVSTAFLAVTPLLFIRVPQPAALENSGKGALQPSLWSDLVAGFRYVVSWPALTMILGMAMIINFLLTPAGSLMPLLVRTVFHGEALQFAGVESAMGIGVIAGGLLLGVWGGFKRRLFTSMLGLMGIGAGSLIIGLAPAWAYPLAVGGMLLMGISNPITNGPLLAALQESVEPEMQGRVFSLIDSAAGLMSPLGLILAGPLADTLGVQSWFIVGGITTFGMGVLGLFIPALANFERPPQPELVSG